MRPRYSKAAVFRRDPLEGTGPSLKNERILALRFVSKLHDILGKHQIFFVIFVSPRA
jgi:hypothetical protein